MSKTRREFAKSLALAGAVAPLVVADAAAQPAAQPAPQPSALGDALTNVIIAAYGQHLTPQERERIARDMQEYAPGIESFRKFRLTNADEPDFTFHALTERW
ncbi:MAG TPA: hypothetical protein VEK11_06070 [Thermoanaerobaculia bacterium]|nr:hypothetical protein [Thermoanaerobaculia bacterium]